MYAYDYPAAYSWICLLWSYQAELIKLLDFDFYCQTELYCEYKLTAPDSGNVCIKNINK